MKDEKLKALKNAIILILTIAIMIIMGSCGSAGGNEHTDATTNSAQSSEIPGDAANPPAEVPEDAQFRFELVTSKGVTVIWHELKYGDESAEVRALKQKLVDIGYLSSASNDYFDGETYQALLNFEREMGLYADGKASMMDLLCLSELR